VDALSLLASTSESKGWQSLPRPVVECIQVQGVRFANESGFDQQKFGRVDQGEAAFPFQEGKRRCNRIAPTKQRGAGIGDAIPPPCGIATTRACSGGSTARGSGASLPKAKCVRDR
jgi:hypothetical protein